MNVTFKQSVFFISILENARRAPKTKKMQVTTQADIDERTLTFGELLMIVVKMLIKTKNIVTKRVIRPDIISGGMRKLA